MAERNWDKELAKVDKQLASLSDEQLLGTASPAPAAKGREPARVPTKSAPAGAAPAAPAAAPRTTTAFGVYGRLVLALAVGLAMLIWPYPAKCGVGLAGYLAAVGVVIMGGLWSSVWTWRHRASRAHTLALLVVLWGLVLGAIDVLPRIGYGRPDANHPASWFCQ
jgi:hypothetical protein